MYSSISKTIFKEDKIQIIPSNRIGKTNINSIFFK
jgi:hypothetical protein